MERQFNGYPVPEFREMFEIATDVKDNKLEKALFEADKLDFTPQVGLSYFGVESQYIDGDPDHVGGRTILCYYAFARYLQSADQASTSTGLSCRPTAVQLLCPIRAKRNGLKPSGGKLIFFGTVYNMVKAERSVSMCKGIEYPYRANQIMIEHIETYFRIFFAVTVSTVISDVKDFVFVVLILESIP